MALTREIGYGDPPLTSWKRHQPHLLVIIIIIIRIKHYVSLREEGAGFRTAPIEGIITREELLVCVKFIRKKGVV